MNHIIRKMKVTYISNVSYVQCNVYTYLYIYIYKSYIILIYNKEVARLEFHHYIGNNDENNEYPYPIIVEDGNFTQYARRVTDGQLLEIQQFSSNEDLKLMFVARPLKAILFSFSFLCHETI